MTGPAQPIEWYLARDNKQYGPLSDTEMMKLVELRHLKSADLVWRAGFTDWTPAATAFPSLAAPPVQPEPAPRAPAEEPRRSQPEPPAEQAQAAPEPAPTPAPTPGPSPHAAAARGGDYVPGDRLTAPFGSRKPAEPQPAVNVEALSDYRAKQGSRGEATNQPSPESNYHYGTASREPEARRSNAAGESRSARQAIWIAPADDAPQPTLRANPSPQEQDRYRPQYNDAFAAPLGHNGDTYRPLGDPGAPDRGLHGGGLGRALRPVDMEPDHSLQVRHGEPADDAAEHVSKPRRPRRIGRTILMTMVLAVLAVGAGLALAQPEKLEQLLGSFQAFVGTVINSGNGDQPNSAALAVARQEAAAPTKTVPAAPLQNFPEGATAIDEMLQTGQLWRIIREEFPEWYSERVHEAARLVAEKKPDEAITKHFVDALVSLRRKNADHAFQASNEKLKQIARAFRDILDVLSQHSAVACYALISSGEASRGMITMFRDPQYSAHLQTGMVAIFEAVAEGRKSPAGHLPARRGDYDIVTRELVALGWSEQDLGMFADSQALARATPDQVCRMVRQWFTAHLAVKDPEAQARLLIESVRPVVAG